MSVMLRSNAIAMLSSSCDSNAAQAMHVRTYVLTYVPLTLNTYLTLGDAREPRQKINQFQGKNHRPCRWTQGKMTAGETG